MKRIIAGLLLVLVFSESTLLAVDARGAAYVGGTAALRQSAHTTIEGRLDTTGPDVLTYTAADERHGSRSFTIPYDRITLLEYQQKAGRRVGATAATTVLFGPVGLLTLMSKKRRHYVTIGYRDDADQGQVAVFEIGKDAVRSTLAILAVRSGQAIQTQGGDARAGIQ